MVAVPELATSERVFQPGFWLAARFAAPLHFTSRNVPPSEAWGLTPRLITLNGSVTTYQPGSYVKLTGNPMEPSSVLCCTITVPALAFCRTHIAVKPTRIIE